MNKFIPVLLILALPGTCLPDEDATENTPAAYVPKDSLEHWVMRDPPHVLDLVMLWAPVQDSTPGHTPWDAIKTKDSPARWDRKGVGKGGSLRKDSRYLKGNVKSDITTKGEGSPHVANLHLYLSGTAAGMIDLRFGTGYSHDWKEMGMAPSFWAEVDSSRYTLVKSCRTGFSGVDEQSLYTLNLPGRQPLWVLEAASCGTWGCDFSLTFSAAPLEEPQSCIE